jgi:hypothetical protein
MDLRRKDLTGLHTHDAITEGFAEADEQFAVNVSCPEARFMPVGEGGPGDGAPEVRWRESAGDQELLYLARLEFELPVVIAMLRDAPATLLEVSATSDHTLGRGWANALSLSEPDSLAPAAYDRVDGLPRQRVAHGKLPLPSTRQVNTGTTEPVRTQRVDHHSV